MRLYLVKYTNTAEYIETLQEVSWRKSYLLDAVLDSMNLNTWYQLRLKIGPAAPFYEELERTDVGFVLELEKYRLAFRIQSTQTTENGVKEVRLFSLAFYLRFTQPRYKDHSVREPIISLLNGLSEKYNFRLVSPGETVVMQTGVLNNYEVLQNALKRVGGWSFRDEGVINTGTDENPRWISLIAVGDFDLFREEVVTATSNPLAAISPTNMLLKNVQTNFDASVTTHLFAIGNTGQGSAVSSRIAFTSADRFAPWIEPSFPLVEIANPRTGQVDIYIQNSNFYRETRNFQTLSVSTSGNTQQSTAGSQLSYEELKEGVYKAGVAKLKEDNPTEIYDIEIVPSTVYLPATICRVLYSRKIHVTRVVTRPVFDIDTEIYMLNQSYDLAKMNLT